MPAPQPHPFPESALAAALNALLDRQPMARERLLRHAGKRIILALPLRPLELGLDGEGRFTVPGPETEADELAGAVTSVTLTPQPAALPKWINGGTVGDLFSAEGDGLLAADLSKAMADFDWVLALRPYLGDIAASRVDQFIQGLAQWRSQAVDAAGRNLAEYAVHEQALLAEPHAAREFIADVDRLREDTDRLEARLKLLEAQRTPE
jgi:ubiquinone biosynthesis protein UbiJ